MIGGPLQYPQGCGLISCLDLTGEPCVLSVMTEFAIRIFFLFPAQHPTNQVPNPAWRKHSDGTLLCPLARLQRAVQRLATSVTLSPHGAPSKTILQS